MGGEEGGGEKDKRWEECVGDWVDESVLGAVIRATTSLRTIHTLSPYPLR
jgi:hypothetical protein